ncbi:hypothetical protein PVAP13_3NG125401 [Panicum virgatum]|uniref:Uncharacterized protein n=1 Tax=Panicum virgatum TaxID=38727 RepID=A0A8T0UA44_PANVG|nr:hypothetical protein PVAP13_3NG125401 [Panicum virgatum]
MQVHKHCNAFTSFTDLLMGSREIDDMSVQDLF